MKPLVGITPDCSGGRYSVKEAYVSSLSRFGIETLILSFDIHPNTIRGLDGIVISGGDDINPSFYGEEPLFELKLIDDLRTTFEMSLFRACLRSARPILGICNGMQLMNVALGGTLYQDIDSQRTLALDHKSGYHTIIMQANDLIAEGSYEVNTAHHQALKDLGKTVESIAKCDDGIVEAISVGNHPFALGVQWHPEREPLTPLNEALFLKFREVCSAA